MTRTMVRGLAIALAGFGFAAASGLLFAQSEENPMAARPSSGYSRLGPAKESTPSTTRGQAAAPVQGPRLVLPVAAGKTGSAPVRRASGDEPLREPGAGAAKPGAGNTRPASPVMLPVETVAPKPPSWYPLDADRQKWTDQVLQFWELNSDKIVTFKCNFKRWDYDPVFGPPNDPFTYGTGIIRYAKPDKGLFKVEKLKKYTPPKQQGGPPVWVEQIGEHWVCDGRSIFEFDVRAQKMIQRILPKDMQGKAIADGPLPFLFGAKMATIKARYWIRIVDPPEGSKGEYWLEAVPKFRQDAANFQQVNIILDEKDFLPKAINIFAPNFDRKNNRAHTEYEFENREITQKGAVSVKDLDILRIFHKEFYEPKLPSGWKKVIEDMNVRPDGPQPVQGPAAGQATRPGPSKTK